MIAPIPMPTPPAPPHDIAYWFRNLGPSEPFDRPGQAERKKIDYRPPRDGGPSH